jgi:urease accessory protein
MDKVIFFTLVVLLFPGVSDAHTLLDGGGFISGLTHPVLGFDHFLAMLSVGILSARIGGRAIWTVPLSFVSIMAVGGILGMRDIAIPAIEFGIAISVLILGLALAMEKKITPLLAMAGVAFFAIFHGHAHGTEMPALAQPFLYAIGFLLGTAGIHMAGLLIGDVSGQTIKGTKIIRFVGVGISCIGVYLVHTLLIFS